MTWNLCASGAALWGALIVFICHFFRVARDDFSEGFGVAMPKAATANRHAGTERATAAILPFRRRYAQQ
jgi:hypothetical protein